VIEVTESLTVVEPPRWASMRRVAPAAGAMLAVVQEAPLVQGLPLFVAKSVSPPGAGAVTSKAVVVAVA
jgi:hypothetical protein